MNKNVRKFTRIPKETTFNNKQTNNKQTNKLNKQPFKK